jgi:uncharacterized delta-60 repeat protein
VFRHSDGGGEWVPQVNEVRAVAIAPDGKIVLAYDVVRDILVAPPMPAGPIHPDIASPATDHHSGFIAVARLNSDGSLDATFHDGGQAPVISGSAELTTAAVAVQADGKIVIAGKADYFAIPPQVAGPQDSSVVQAPEFAVARLDADGSVDNSFGGGSGLLFFGFPQAVQAADFDPNPALSPISVQAMPSGLALGADGSILVTGTVSERGTAFQDFAAARLRPDGSFDPGFGDAGQVLFGFSSHRLPEATAVTIQPDGKILLAGFAQNASSPYEWEFAIARLTGSVPPLQLTFLPLSDILPFSGTLPGGNSQGGTTTPSIQLTPVSLSIPSVLLHSENAHGRGRHHRRRTPIRSDAGAALRTLAAQRTHGPSNSLITPRTKFRALLQTLTLFLQGL